ncbi:antibiotic biosynthesis monooxygenase [Myxococcus sp. K15C18031901]|nr:antibiotic biosynthesis monooxygenase [Myxococcus dinghuensis]
MASAVLLLSSCTTTHAAPDAPERTASMKMPLDLDQHPNLHFRIDRITVPTASRAELETAMHRITALLREQPGFLGNVVFERKGDAGTLVLVTMATWESAEAMAKAGEAVRAHNQRIGFDAQALFQRLGATMERGDYIAPRELQ